MSRIAFSILAAFALVAFLGTEVSHAVILGPPAVARATPADPFSLSGDVIVFREPWTASLTVPQSEVLTWSMYSGTAGGWVTPLLLEYIGGGHFQMTGVGTPRQSDGSGKQTFDFDVVSGNDTFVSIPGANAGTTGAYFIGFFNGEAGASGTTNNGVIENDPTTAYTLGDSLDSSREYTRIDVNVGTALLVTPADVVAGTVVSAQADDTHVTMSFDMTSVPEPASLSLLAGGAMLMLRRKRR